LLKKIQLAFETEEVTAQKQKGFFWKKLNKYYFYLREICENDSRRKRNVQEKQNEQNSRKLIKFLFF
jgi:hypothetical protein